MGTIGTREQAEGEGFDDEAMFAMDSLLGRAFKSARQDRTAAKQTAEALTHFKFRTCTLLEIYLRCAPRPIIIYIQVSSETIHRIVQ